MAQPDSPPGQQQMHTIQNTNTGETKQITQEEWRTNGDQLKADGWVRVDDDTPSVNPLGS